jgi:hypothetical protein
VLGRHHACVLFCLAEGFGKSVFCIPLNRKQFLVSRDLSHVRSYRFMDLGAVQLIDLRAYRSLGAGLKTIGKMESSYEKSCVDFRKT